MHTAGFAGGSSIIELGPPSDLELFFDFIRDFAGPANASTLILDRLYRRYLTLDQVQDASRLLANVKDAFQRVATIQGQADSLKLSDDSKLDLRRPTLAEVFEHFFAAFDHCAESARLNHEEFRDFPGYEPEPIRIVRTDEPWFSIEMQRQLAEYDTLDGEPFWKAGHSDGHAGAT